MSHAETIRMRDLDAVFAVAHGIRRARARARATSSGAALVVAAEQWFDRLSGGALSSTRDGEAPRAIVVESRDDRGCERYVAQRVAHRRRREVVQRRVAQHEPPSLPRAPAASLLDEVALLARLAHVVGRLARS